MTVYRDNYPYNIEAPQKLYIEYSHDIIFDYSTGKYPDGTESQWHWESTYIPITHQINGLSVGRHEWMRIRIGEPNFWTYPIRMSANITNIQTIESEINEETGEFSFTIKLTFEDGSTKESDPITIRNGVDGTEIVSSEINEDGYLIITYSDGRVDNAGMAKGSDATGIPITGPDDYVLSISGNNPVWIMPLQVLNAALIANTPLTYDINTGNLEINQADTNTDGYLSSTDWNTFNDKQEELESGVNLKTINSQSLLGSGNIVITSGKPKTYQTLVSATNVTMDTELGINGIIILGHDVTLTLDNLVSGDEGNIEVTQSTPDHTITIIPTPFIINDGSSVIELLSGIGSKTVLSYSYDGTTLLVTYNKLLNIPTALSELSDDSTHRLVTDTEKNTWNGKQDSLGFTPEDSANKVTSWQLTPDDTHYPSEKLVKDSLNLKQNVPVNYYPSAITFGNNNQQYDISGTTWVTATAGIPDVAGHLLADVLTAIATPNDGAYFAVLEASGAASETNPNTITFTFNDVTDLNVFKARFRYVGSASHRQVIELYNKNTLAWDHLIEFSYTDNYEILSSEILNPLDYIDSGTVIARVRHLDTGINTHYNLIDFIVLGSGGGAGGDSIQTAIQVPFTPDPDLDSTNTQEAIIEVKNLGIFEVIEIACSDLTTNNAAATNVAEFHMPFDGEFSGLPVSSLDTVCTGSTHITDINLNGSSILSTKLSIDASENNSITAATPCVVSGTTFTKGDKVSIDRDQVGATIPGKGHVVSIPVLRK